MTLEQMKNIIAYGMSSLYNTATGLLVITDLVDGGDREEETCGIRAGNGDWMYGLMTCYVDPEKADGIRAEFDTLTEYALGCIPAPASCAPNSMDFLDIYSTDDIEIIARELLEEHPEAWIEE